MFLVRAAFWLSLAIFLLPLDERDQARTFCERYPSTCAAGAELWSAFRKKAEFALPLAARIVQDWMTKSDAKRGATAANPQDQTLRTGPDPLPAREPTAHGRDRNSRLGT